MTFSPYDVKTISDEGRDDEYTPSQRRLIDRGIAKVLEDIKKGRIHGRSQPRTTLLPISKPMRIAAKKPL